MERPLTAAARAAAPLDGLFAAIDGMDTERFLSFLTDDCEFRYGSAPPARGKDAIRAAVDGFFASIAGLSHSLVHVLEQRNMLVCEGDVRYVRHDQSDVVLPFVNVFETSNGRISGYRIYIDSAPLYQQD